jgi:outer membrane protein TolC
MGWKLWRGLWLICGILALGPADGTALDGPPPPGAGAIDIFRLETLDLETAKTVAVSGSPTFAAAIERVRQAEERVRQAQADYWPRLDAGASGARVELSDREAQSRLRAVRRFDPDAGIADPEDVYRANLTAGWEVFTGFRRRFENARARFGEEASRSALDEARRLLLFSVARAFYEAQLAREDITIAKADEAFNLRQAEEARARRRAGTGSLSDVLNFEIQVNAARSALNDADRAFAVSRIALASIMGLPEGRLPMGLDLAPLTEPSSEDLLPPDDEPLIRFAEAHRPDILESGFRLQEAEAGIGVARSEYYPTLSLEASADGYRENSARFGQDDFGNSVGLFMNYNLFSGGATRARVAEARYAKREAERLDEAVRVDAFSEVHEAIANVVASQKELALQRENAVLVQRNRDLVEKGYAAGQESLVRLNEAQRDLISAQARLALARVALQQSWEGLDAATAANLGDAYGTP